MVDHYSDYIELDSLSGNTSANSVMKRQFDRHGITDELITATVLNSKVTSTQGLLENTVSP